MELQDGREVACSEVALTSESSARRASRLRDLEAEILICGAISRDLARSVAGAGIEILSYVSGPVDEVVKAFVAGRLAEPRFVLPCCWPGARNGFRRCCRRRRGRR